MNAFALHDVSDQAVLRRWGVSAVAIVAAHAALIVLAMNWYTQRPEPGVAMPAIMVDLAPITSSPEAAPMDMTPGPEMQQADASPPEPAAAEPMQEQIAPTPPQEKPEVVAPPEQKQQPTPEKPEPAKVVPGQQAGAGQAESRPARRQKALGCAACTAHQRATARRASGACGIGDQRGRGGLCDGRL